MRRLILLALIAVSFPPALRAAEPDPFNAQVRPILARYCFKCHGPDDRARKSKLRLDVHEEALKGGRSGKPAIVPGKPGDSELVRRISATDDSEVMPPPHTKTTLTDAEKQVLRRWITDGADYRPHWAFVAPREAPLPVIRNPHSSTSRNPVDAFILARLEKEGLKPAPEADRWTLVRRVYLDLIGLPPTPTEAEAFVRDPSPAAYEALVDRLLASPHYGERWARRWLDLARYADTNGYEKDRPRSVWPWRDWVINAINDDMPFDRFTVEQIAGDVLPGATLSQQIATGFHRNTMLNEEGGIDPLEFRFYAVADRLATTGTTWLGLTVGCAQCHTHKFDPISHREYYQLFAFLNNADEPALDVPSPEIVERRREIEKQIATRVADLPNRWPGDAKAESLEKAFQAWREREAARSVRWTVLKPAEAKANVPHLEVQDDDSVFVSGDQTKSDTYTLTFRGLPAGVTTIRLEVLPDERLPRHGPGRGYYEGPFGDFFLSEFRLFADGKPVKLARASHSFARGGTSAAFAIDGDPQSGWAIDGGQGQAHWAVFNLAAPLPASETVEVRMLFERYHAAGLGRFRIATTTDTRTAEARPIPAETEELLLTAAEKQTPAQRQQLRETFLLAAPELAKERQAIDALRKQLPALPTTLVFAERPPANPRPTFLQNRGEFLQPTERVEPGVPAFLPALTPGKTLPALTRPGSPSDRLIFARWLVSPDNPLVARVTVNRQWAAFFGTGLVRTVSDFGYQGEFPSHPELLDWLALDFIRQGWSMKMLHRLIVTSATYRQASRVSPELLAADPQNRLLARGPRVRPEAEMLRDAALVASDLLAPRLGGPSVFPPQPPGVTTEGAYGRLDWKVSPGADRYRRGLYTFAKRTAPYALFATFDGPSGEVCVARREVSNTPLQALTLLNDATFIETSQALGRLLATRPGSAEERIEEAFRRVLTRLPTVEEKGQLLRFWQAQRERFAKGELDAAKVAGPGAGDAVERAAWTVLVRALFNLDEFTVRG
jgi:hypothetical protein